MSIFTLVTGRKLPRSTRDRLLTQDLRRLEHFARWPKTWQGAASRSHLDQLETHDTVVYVAELYAGKLDHVDLDTLGAEVIEQGFQQTMGLVMQEEGAIQKVDAGMTPNASCCRRFSWSSMRTWIMIWLS